jgi:hypothetical protein
MHDDRSNEQFGKRGNGAELRYNEVAVNPKIRFLSDRRFY